MNQKENTVETEHETLRNIQNNYAKDRHFDDWIDFIESGDISMHTVDLIAKLYHQARLKIEQNKIKLSLDECYVKIANNHGYKDEVEFEKFEEYSPHRESVELYVSQFLNPIKITDEEILQECDNHCDLDLDNNGYSFTIGANWAREKYESK